MTAGDAKLQAGLGRIRLRFLSVLDERLDTMEAHYDALAKHEQRDDALAVIQTEAHKIAGTARTVGYEELGSLALDLDQSISAYARSTTRDDALISSLVAKIDVLIEAGADVIRAHMQETAAV